MAPSSLFLISSSDMKNTSRSSSRSTHRLAGIEKYSLTSLPGYDTCAWDMNITDGSPLLSQCGTVVATTGLGMRSNGECPEGTIHHGSLCWGYGGPAITVANPDGPPDSVSTSILLCCSSRTASRWWVLLASLRVKKETIQASKAAGSVGGMWCGARSRAYSHSGCWYDASTFRRKRATIQASNAAGSDGGTSRMVPRVVAIRRLLR
ncbi:hypothetical protein EV421DRAFT_1231097 [Armillaria borealis]|uniref:Uncharacterized protein n=1 Tax=Armillaria borealis TaxID=47425 RepID=A0AA39J3P7_9AGAR|nr:hypothetical protein EV421DRAFT_1231097 [Armillaria borealis]